MEEQTNETINDQQEKLTLLDSTQDIFTNRQIDPGDIPTTAILEYSGLQPAYRMVSLISTAIFFSIPTVVVLFLWLMGNEFFMAYAAYLWLGIGLLCGLVMLLVVLGFKKKSYAVRERDIVYNEGVDLVFVYSHTI